MLKDCIKFARGCHECQKHGGIQHVPVNELHLIIKSWPFRGRALDLIGDIKPASSKSHRYVLVAIDYFKKWVDAVPLTNIYQDTVIGFIQSHIMCRYGTPETITTYHDLVFIGRKVKEFVTETGIKFLTSTPYYTQANGQIRGCEQSYYKLDKKTHRQKSKKLAYTFESSTLGL